METKTETGQVTLRRAEWGDLGVLGDWRNNPAIYEADRSMGKPISPDGLAEWFKSYDSPMGVPCLLMAFCDGKPIGYFAVSVKDGPEIPEVGICIGEPSLWGKRINGNRVAAMVANAAYEYLRDHGVKQIQAVMPKVNQRANRHAVAMGYRKIGEDSDSNRWLKDLC